MNEQGYERYLDALHDSRRQARAAQDAIRAGRDKASLVYLTQKSLAVQAYRAGMPVEDIAKVLDRSVGIVREVMLAEVDAIASHRVWTAADVVAEAEPNPDTPKPVPVPHRHAQARPAKLTDRQIRARLGGGYSAGHDRPRKRSGYRSRNS